MTKHDGPRFVEAVQVASDVLGEAGCAGEQLAPDGTLVIQVLDRGYVLMGRWYQRGSWVEMREAKIVQRWGTETGLGALASKGPTIETVLLNPCTVRFREPRGLPMFVCDEKAWSR